MATAETSQAQQVALHFFDYLFGKQEGFLCIATASPDKSNFRQNFFKWPEQKSIAVKFTEEQARNRNVWFCVNLLMKEERKKEFCLPSAFAWADLDYIVPSRNGDNNAAPYPTCIVESSPSRFQAYWKLEGEPVPADVAEDFSHKLAYKIGADKSGWDLTQLLRIPWTNNFKYDPPVQVKILEIEPVTYEPSLFDAITIPAADPSIPAELEVPTDLPPLESVIYRYKAEGRTDAEFTRLYVTEPDANADWSRVLWRFIHKCFEIGMTSEEVLVVAENAACNKYKRDNRPISYLWRDVTKAAQEQKRFELLLSNKVEIVSMPHLADFDEFEEDTFIKDYKTWANQATDAPEQYHELSCFITLSAIVSSGLWLGVHWGELVPNLWGLVLGESTLTRKTTAMRLAIDMLTDIDDSLILATDGSAEGLLTGLSGRPERVSIFWKDEVSGFFDSINRKDYLAGMPETLTHLYDVPPVYHRRLRKETITVSKPYFIFFGGGIRDKVYSLINEEYIVSGFLPRFLVVSGENDLSRLRRTGPPTEISTERKDHIVNQLADMKERYNATTVSTIAGQSIEWAVRTEARLTDDAWAFFNEIEDVMTKAGMESDLHYLALPMFGRLSFSLLKMAVLIAASRRPPDAANRLIVEKTDVKQAAFYIEKWGHYSIDLLLNAGRSQNEKLITRALGMINRKPGLMKSELMQRMHLTARDAKDLIDTMVQRGLIDTRQEGKGTRLYSSGISHE